MQQVTQPGDRVAILAPQGIDYVVGFFAAIKAKTIAVPLFALCGGHITLMSPISFVRRPGRWISELAAESSHGRTFPAVLSGFVAAFSVPGDDDAGERLVTIAERAPGAGRAEQAGVTAAIRAAISRHHALPVADVVLVPAGAIPRTASGKIARSACRTRYLAGGFDRPGQ